MFEVVGHKYFREVSSTNAWTWRVPLIGKDQLKQEIFSAQTRTIVRLVEDLVQKVMLPEMFGTSR